MSEKVAAKCVNGGGAVLPALGWREVFRSSTEGTEVHSEHRKEGGRIRRVRLQKIEN